MGYLSCNSHLSVATCDSQDPSTSSRTLAVKEFDYGDIQAATGNFSNQKLLGRGSHGAVYKATLHDGRRVAVKRSSSARAPTPENNEIDILSQIRSPRLVNLVGVATTTAGDNIGRLLVVEFMKNGTLYDVLHSAPSPPPWPRRLRLALQTAKAVLTLHSSDPPVVHRDIKSANVLIDRRFNARLGDFGLALRFGGAGADVPPAGTLGYLDPCYLTPDNLSTKTDVFSFGILLLEIISGRKAIDIAHSPQYILDWAVPLIKKGKISTVYDPRVPPPKDSAVRRQVAVLAAKCLRSCGELRPSMAEVVDCLSELGRSESSRRLQHFLNINNPCIASADVGRAPAKTRLGKVRDTSNRNLMELLKDDGGNGDASASAGTISVRRSSSRRSTTARSS